MATVTFEHINKNYGDVQVVKDMNLAINDGEFMVLVGPSGCGKTTSLRMIAGLEEITSGDLKIGDRIVNDVPPKDRDIAMVFQSYALYPHMTVRDNMAFGLKLRKLAKADIEKRVNEAAGILSLEKLLDRKPKELSGGQRQRVALGRAIVREPSVFLMDEPLSNLDAKLRVGMRASLAQLHARLSVTSVYVTHDQTEAMTLGQRVAVMRDGRIVQVDVPQRLYRAPRDLFVATVIGSPSMNHVEATIDGDEIAFGQFRVPLHPGRRPARGIDRVVLGVRPEAFNEAAFAKQHLPRIDVTVDVLEELGSDAYVFFRVAAPRVTVESRDTPDDESSLLVEEDSLFTAWVDPATTGRVGASLELAVDPSSFHFFDVRTGESLLH